MTNAKNNEVIEADALLKLLSQKSWNDSEYKNNLIANPVEVISKEIGKEFMLPDNREVVVEDQSDSDTIYINIPAQLNLNELELSDEQLDLVSGGEGVGAGIAIGVCFLIGLYIGTR